MRSIKTVLPIIAVLVLIRVGTCLTIDDTQRYKHHPTKSPVGHFAEVSFGRFPQSVVMRDFCNEPHDAAECWRNVRASGKVWAGDVNGDHIKELLLFPGSLWTGSGGSNYYLYQRQGRIWESIVMAGDSDGWFTDRPRFDILPIVRSGYRDLRIGVNDCLKWSDGKYVPYDPADYEVLVPTWFDDADPHQAEIFWTIAHANAEPLRLEPLWFPISGAFFSDQREQNRPNRKQSHAMVKEWQNDGGFPRFVMAAVDDAAQKIRWVSLQRAGVWGIRGDRAFLLIPRHGYLGVCTLAIKGEWLLGDDDCASEDEPDVRYNLRTHELRITTSEELQ